MLKGYLSNLMSLRHLGGKLGNSRYPFIMNVCLIIGSEGTLGKQIVLDKLKFANVIVIGYDVVENSYLKHDRYYFVSGSVQSRNEIFRLRTVIEDIQNKNNIDKEIDSIINVFAANDFKYDTASLPTHLTPDEWMLWGWQNYPDEDFLNQYDVNVIGIHRILTSLYETYKNSKSCSIVNFSSQYAKRNIDQNLFKNLGHFIFKPPAYSASKAAIENYTGYLSQVFKNTGIRANVIAPGVVNTGQSKEFKEKYSRLTNAGRLMQPEEILGAVDFLTSERSTYMNGSCLTLDGGWSTR